jgi:serine/threonine protein kinase
MVGRVSKPLVISVEETTDGRPSQVRVFERGPIVVGRGASANLILDGDGMAELHGVFDFEPDGALTFCDLGSETGTELNGRRLATDEVVAILEDDVICLGGRYLRVLGEHPTSSLRWNPDREPATQSASLTGTSPPGDSDASGEGISGVGHREAAPSGGSRPRRHRGELFQPGDQIAGGRYEIVDLLGAGGMSAVYRAKDFRMKGAVAIKVLSPELAMRADALERFEREAQSARRIRSPHVVEIYDLGSEDGTRYIVMELLNGEPLSKLIDRAPLSVARATAVMLDVCNGVIAAHDEEIIHRDLKPDNIFLLGASGDRTRAKVLDFGISKTSDSRLTETGTVFGTRHYQSPEQVMNSAMLDARSDVFALGVIYFECLTQRPPHEGKTPFILSRNVVEGRFTRLRQLRPELPQEVEEIIERAMKLDPTHRYASVRALRESLRPFAATEAEGLDRITSVDNNAHRTSATLAGGTEVLPTSERTNARQLAKTEILPQRGRTQLTGGVSESSRAGDARSRRSGFPIRVMVTVGGSVALLVTMAWFGFHHGNLRTAKDRQPYKDTQSMAAMPVAAMPPADRPTASPAAASAGLIVTPLPSSAIPAQRPGETRRIRAGSSTPLHRKSGGGHYEPLQIPERSPRYPSLKLSKDTREHARTID